MEELLLQAILDLGSQEIMDILQAASELDGDMYERMSKAYYEVVGTDFGQGEEDE